MAKKPTCFKEQNLKGLLPKETKKNKSEGSFYRISFIMYYWFCLENSNI